MYPKDPRDNPPSGHARMARAQARDNQLNGDGSPVRSTREARYNDLHDFDWSFEPMVNALAEQIDSGNFVVPTDEGIDITTPYRTCLLQAEAIVNKPNKEPLDGTEALVATLMLELINKYAGTGTSGDRFAVMPPYLRALGLLMFGVDYDVDTPKQRHYTAAELEPFREVYCQHVSMLGGPLDQPSNDNRISPVQTRKMQKAILEVQSWEAELANEDPNDPSLYDDAS